MTIMAGHIMLPSYSQALNPSLKDEDVLPATLSPEIITGLLKEKLGFNGLVITDSTTMAGLAMAMDRRLAVPRTIAAGCDMFLFTKNLEEDFAYMKEGVKNGTITQERLDDAVTKILALKAALKLHKKNNIPSLEAALKTLSAPESKNLALECADRAITLVKNKQELLPISPQKYKRVLFYCIESGEGQMGYGISKEANQHFMQKLRDQGFEVTEFKPKEGFEGMMASSEEYKKNYDLIIYSANMATKSNQTIVRIEWCQPMGANVPVYINSIPTIFISFRLSFDI